MIGCDLLPRLVKLLGAAEKGLRAHTVMCLAASLSSCKCWERVGGGGDTGVYDMSECMYMCIISYGDTVHTVYIHNVHIHNYVSNRVTIYIKFCLHSL